MAIPHSVLFLLRWTFFFRLDNFNQLPFKYQSKSIRHSRENWGNWALFCVGNYTASDLCIERFLLLFINYDWGFEQAVSNSQKWQGYTYCGNFECKNGPNWMEIDNKHKKSKFCYFDGNFYKIKELKMKIFDKCLKWSTRICQEIKYVKYLDKILQKIELPMTVMLNLIDYHLNF